MFGLIGVGANYRYIRSIPARTSLLLQDLFNKRCVIVLTLPLSVSEYLILDFFVSPDSPIYIWTVRSLFWLARSTAYTVAIILPVQPESSCYRRLSLLTKFHCSRSNNIPISMEFWARGPKHRPRHILRKSLIAVLCKYSI